MGDHRQVVKQSRYVTSRPDQLSLAIPPWVGAVSTSNSWVTLPSLMWITPQFCGDVVCPVNKVA